MKNGFVKSSPHFFRLIFRSFWLLLVSLLLLALFVPAPLQTAADPSTTPNPAKSAWFLLWIQELVSWSRLMIWPVMASDSRRKTTASATSSGVHCRLSGD